MRTPPLLAARPAQAQLPFFLDSNVALRDRWEYQFRRQTGAGDFIRYSCSTRPAR